MAGLDCAKAKIAVVDSDCYKDIFKADAHSKAFYQKVISRSKFCQRTQSGGWQHFFKWSENKIIKSKNAIFSGIDLKAHGGYVCLYQMPFNPKAGFETFKEFYDALPVFDFSIKQKVSAGWTPGNRNNNLNKLLYSAINRNDLGTAIEVLNRAVESELPVSEICRTFKSVVDSGITPKLGAVKQDATEKSPSTELKIISLSDAESVPIEWLKDGWIPKGEFTVIIGQTNMGKTSIMLRWLVKIAQKENKPVLYYGPENPVSKIKEIVGKENENHIRIFQDFDENKQKLQPGLSDKIEKKQIKEF